MWVNFFQTCGSLGDIKTTRLSNQKLSSAHATDGRPIAVRKEAHIQYESNHYGVISVPKSSGRHSLHTLCHFLCLLHIRRSWVWAHKGRYWMDATLAQLISTYHWVYFGFTFQWEEDETCRPSLNTLNMCDCFSFTGQKCLFLACVVINECTWSLWDWSILLF